MSSSFPYQLRGTAPRIRSTAARRSFDDESEAESQSGLIGRSLRSEMPTSASADDAPERRIIHMAAERLHPSLVDLEGFRSLGL